jgi:hypothetical protein
MKSNIRPWHGSVRALAFRVAFRLLDSTESQKGTS